MARLLGLLMVIYQFYNGFYANMFADSAADAFAPSPVSRLVKLGVLGAGVLMMLWRSRLAVLLVLFISFGSYTRRTTVSGQLVPQGGVLRLYTPQQAVVLEKRVREGQQVAKGEVLYILSSDRLGSGAQEIQAAISQQISRLSMKILPRQVSKTP